MDSDDTIVAVASAPGGAIRGVVRISGPRAVAIAGKMAPLVADHLAHVRGPRAIASTLPLLDDRSLPVDLFVWSGSRSYTREPTVEFHTIGSPPLVDLVVRSACDEGARLAEPGEFTLRAFLAGRIDLTQAEAVLGVIDAEGPRALETALSQLAGGMAVPLGGLREELLLLLADLEAGLDFADEQIEFIEPKVLADRLAEVLARIDALIRQLGTRKASTSLPWVVLAGPTNAGKSSLFNALVARWGNKAQVQPAIVSPQPGATRDYLTACVSCEGVACVLVDTAGAEELTPEPSVASSARTVAQSVREEASLVIICTEASKFQANPKSTNQAECHVITKGDEVQLGPRILSPDTIVTSAVTGEGLDELEKLVAQRITEATLVGDHAAMVPSTALRSEDSLQSSLEALRQAEALAARHESEELVAAELRLALDHLGQIAGAVYTDDVLDRVFSRFCIGK
ncbi:MAG: tRNA modification GTPase [Aeoliella sp.]